MPAFLSDEWFALALDAARELPAVPGVDARLAYVVSGTPSGKVQFVAELVEGRLAALRRGKADAADCTVQCSYELVCGLLEASADRDVAFMRGDLKLDGDYATYVLRVAPWLASEATERVRRALAAVTEC